MPDAGQQVGSECCSPAAPPGREPHSAMSVFPHMAIVVLSSGSSLTTRRSGAVAAAGEPPADTGAKPASNRTLRVDICALIPNFRHGFRQRSAHPPDRGLHMSPGQPLDVRRPASALRAAGASGTRGTSTRPRGGDIGGDNDAHERVWATADRATRTGLVGLRGAGDVRQHPAHAPRRRATWSEAAAVAIQLLLPGRARQRGLPRASPAASTPAPGSPGSPRPRRWSGSRASPSLVAPTGSAGLSEPVMLWSAVALGVAMLVLVRFAGRATGRGRPGPARRRLRHRAGPRSGRSGSCSPRSFLSSARGRPRSAARSCSSSAPRSPSPCGGSPGCPPASREPLAAAGRPVVGLRLPAGPEPDRPRRRGRSLAIARAHSRPASW